LIIGPQNDQNDGVFSGFLDNGEDEAGEYNPKPTDSDLEWVEFFIRDFGNMWSGGIVRFAPSTIENEEDRKQLMAAILKVPSRRGAEPNNTIGAIVSYNPNFTSSPGRPGIPQQFAGFKSLGVWRVVRTHLHLSEPNEDGRQERYVNPPHKVVKVYCVEGYL
jgi:hypothetical protein